MSALRRFNMDDEDYTYEADEGRAYSYDEEYDDYDEADEGAISASESIKNFFKRGKENLLSIFKKEKNDEEYDDYDDEHEEEAYEETEEEGSEPEEYEEGETSEETAEEVPEKRQPKIAKRRTSKEKAERADDEEYTDDDIKKYKERMGIYGYSFSDRAKTRQRRTDSAVEYVSSPEWKYRGNVNSIIETAPWNMEDVEKIAVMIKKDNAVIMDLSRMKGERSDAVNFIDGVCFILNYRFEQIGKSSYYLAAPKGFMRSIDMGPYTGKRKGR